MNPELLYKQAVGFHRGGNLAEAERLYLQILSTDASSFAPRHMLGVIRAQQGRNSEALELIDAALKLQPNDTNVLMNYGNVLGALGRLEEALASYDRTLAIQPNDAKVLNSRGNTLLALKRFDDALVSYDRALAIRPDYFNALYNRGNALWELGRFDEALSSYNKALLLKPDDVAALNNRGNALRELKRFDDALVSYDRALAIKPDYFNALYNRGIAFLELKRFLEALASNDRALAIKPDYAEALIGRGNALRELERFEEALASYDKALATKPDNVEALNGRGVVLWNMARFNEALESYDKVLTIKPDWAAAWSNRGNALRDLRRLEEAIESFDRAIAADPDYAQAYWHKSLCQLLMENFDEGWRLYGWHKKLPLPIESRSYPQPFWTGAEDINGKTLFLYSEQGLGDTIHFYRYVALVQTRGAKVIISAQDTLTRLLKAAIPAVEFVGAHTVPPYFDYHISLISLPQAFGTCRDTIPATIPYLWAEPERAKAWASRIGKDGFKIGISWQGKKRERMGDRSFPLTCFEGLSKVPGIRLISLQKNVGAEQLLNMPSGMETETLSDHFDHGPDAFIDTAAVMENMDLIITSDSAIAHLAGALGRPTWVALKYVPEWRWFLDRSDSPWYPTMRLFRQQVDGDWISIFKKMEAQAAALAGTK